MIVFIAGLGLMGASYAQKLREAGHTVHGFDHNPHVTQEALDLGLIARSDVDALTTCDVCVCALPPQEIIPFIKEHLSLLQSVPLLTDIAGVKVPLEGIAGLLPDPSVYRSHHPMAGKAYQGLKHRDAQMFCEAVCIKIATPYANALAERYLDELIAALAFKRTVTLTAQAHDEAIAYVSQLTHVCAAALMHQPNALEHYGVAGDSFRDLTRIAKIQAPLWRDLFLLNAPSLVAQIEAFEVAIAAFKKALISTEADALEAWLQTAHDIKAQMDERP